MSEKLKPCPFCGKPAKLIEYPEDKTYFVRCNCGASTRIYSYRKLAIKAWNKRAK